MAILYIPWFFVIIYLDFQDRRLIDSPSKRPLPDVDESNSGMELVKKPGDDNSMDMDTAWCVKYFPG